MDIRKRCTTWPNASRHFWASELFMQGDPDWPNQPRHMDLLWPLWNLLDLTPEGRDGSSGSAIVRPQIRIVSRPNTDNRNFSFFVTIYEFRAGAPGDTQTWKRINNVRLKSKGGGGRDYYCSLYHHRRANTVSQGSPPIWRKTGSIYIFHN